MNKVELQEKLSAISVKMGMVREIYCAINAEINQLGRALSGLPIVPEILVAEEVTTIADHEPHHDDEKPETIKVTVSGIDMGLFGMGKSAGNSQIDWAALIIHPPFQMFMSDNNFPNPDGIDAVELAVAFIKSQQSAGKGELVFYAEYAKWFKSKGYWPNEDPFGRPISTPSP